MSTLPLTEAKDLVLTPPEPLSIQAKNPYDLLQIALQNGAAIDVIERLSALQEKAVARDAEMQFNEAMNEAQSELGRIAPDMTNPSSKSRYASYAALDKKIRPIYTKHGFSLSFDSGDSPLPETVRVVCYVSHRGGHTRKYTGPPMPSDTRGPKGDKIAMTAVQGVGTAMSYGARYLLKYIFNIAVGEEDTDGNSGTIDQSWLTAQLDEIKRCETVDGLKAAFKAAAGVALDEVKDFSAYRALKMAAQTRGKELEGR